MSDNNGVSDRMRKLEAIKNRSTKYEVVASRGDQSILVAYTNAHSRHGLLRACRTRADLVIKVLGISDTDMLMPEKKATDGFSLGSWQIRFSGRTQRDCIIQGELPYLDEVGGNL